MATLLEKRFEETFVPRGYRAIQNGVGLAQIPQLVAAHIDSPPQELVAFNDLSRANMPNRAGIHFYKSDASFQRVIRLPAAYVDTFRAFQFVITPDLTLGQGMPLWLRQQKTFQSRAVGAVWQSRGLKVIPTVRWAEVSDLGFVLEGIPVGCAIAISNYGLRRDPVLKAEFENGLDIVTGILKPTVIILFGSRTKKMANWEPENCRIIEMTPNSTLQRGKPKGMPDVDRLF